ncbi:unnamed protein product, partial [Candidula unifasciata]
FPGQTDSRGRGGAVGDAEAKIDLGLPHITSEIMKVAVERHQKGLMHPHIYQILTQ